MFKLGRLARPPPWLAVSDKVQTLAGCGCPLPLPRWASPLALLVVAQDDIFPSPTPSSELRPGAEFPTRFLKLHSLESGMQPVLNASLWGSLQAWMEEREPGRQPHCAQNLRLPKRGLLHSLYIKEGQWTQERSPATRLTLMGGSPEPT